MKIKQKLIAQYPHGVFVFTAVVRELQQHHLQTCPSLASMISAICLYGPLGAAAYPEKESVYSGLDSW